MRICSENASPSNDYGGIKSGETKSDFVELIGIGSRKDAVFDFCLNSPFQLALLRFWQSSSLFFCLRESIVSCFGGEFLVSYSTLLNKNQVFDMGRNKPDKVLQRLYATLEQLKHNGDGFAAEIQNRLRIIVAGGDGIASWLLGVVSDLKLPQPPPIATVLLGTGNNLPFSLIIS